MFRLYSRLVVFVFICSVHFLSAQQLPLQVFAPAGMEAVQGNYDFAWTFGEPFTFTYPQSFLILTQGYHQPELKVVYTGKLQVPAIKVYPNPTQQFLFLEQADGGEYTLYATGGQLLRQGVLEEKTTIDLHPYAAAPYVLHVRFRGNDYTYSIIKID